MENVTQTSDLSITDSAALAILIGQIVLFLIVYSIIAYIIQSLLLARLFKKAGVEQWIAWIPVYNTWKLLEMGDQKGYWAIVALVPVLNIVSVVFLAIAAYHIGKKLGKTDWFVLLAVFMPIVWLIWVGFDSSQWPKKNTKKTVNKLA